MPAFVYFGSFYNNLWGDFVIKVSASILACNTAYLGDSVIEVDNEGADIIHIDVMDGHYVENITFGPQTVRDLKHVTKLPIEVHLELYNPERLIENFIDAGADIITVQLDCCVHPIRIANKIKAYGKKVGLAVNPSMDLSQLKYLAQYIDYLLLMSVEPGFGGQVFEYTTYNKIRQAKQILKDIAVKIPIGVDGGINLNNACFVKQAGAEILVIGSALFLNNDLRETILKLKSNDDLIDSI